MMTLETSLNSAEKEFLYQLYQQTDGDQSRQVDTVAIGTAIGVDKINSRKISEELIGHGLVAVKTLSGGIGITRDGLAEIQRLGDRQNTAQPSLGKTRIIDANGCQAVGKTLVDLKKALGRIRLPYDAMAELVIDMKTIEIQILSPKPKTAIIRSCLISMLAVLEHVNATTAMDLIHGLIGSSDQR